MEKRELTRISTIPMLWAVATVCGAELVNEVSKIRGVHIPGTKVAENQSSPACPNNICPGLGNNFYLPGTNALSINTGGNVFFINKELGDCAIVSRAEQHARSFSTADSMQQFITKTMAEADLSGSYKTSALTVKGTAEGMTGTSSNVTTSFHSTHMDINAVTHAIDFQQNSKCFAESNIEPSFLGKFTALAKIDPFNVGEAASWAPYVSFLQDQGSHIMMQQQIGSRFQQWESSTSASADIDNVLKAKACAEVEGVKPGGGWSVQGCAAYSSEEKEKALRTAATSRRVILGGTAATRAALTKNVDSESLNAFIDSAELGSQAVRFLFKPIWELLSSIYSPACASAGEKSEACENLQRATNLQAAYEGWTAIGCPMEKDGGGGIYQIMAIDSTTTLGINTYRCTVSKTGCRSDNSCNNGGAIGTVCYCYGKQCIDTGAQISGTDMYRDAVRGSESGGHDQGVNKSCWYPFLASCRCDHNWSGGLPTRNIYLQGTSTYLERN